MAATSSITTVVESIEPAYNVVAVGSAPQFTQQPITTSLDTSTVDNDGGQIITMTFTSLPIGTYTFHVGPLVSTSDPLCYSGIEGQGSSIIIDDTQEVKVVLPPLSTGGPYRFFMVHSNGDTEITDEILTVVDRCFHNKRHGLARLFPPKWLAGPRSLLNEVYPQL